MTAMSKIELFPGAILVLNDSPTNPNETDDRLQSNVPEESSETMVNNPVENATHDIAIDLNPTEPSEPTSILKSDSETDANPAREQDSNDESSSDNMPHLLWPEKKPKVSKSNGATSATTTSQDTGFGSDSTADTPSPDEASKGIDDSISKNSSETSVNKSGEQAEVDTPVEDDVMNILGNGLLKKKILVPGEDVDTRPNNGDTVTLKVDGVLEGGTHVDTGEISFILNDGDVILAFDIAVALMEEGEKCELFTPAKYAYGSIGREPNIPKEANITYTLELLNIQIPPELSSLSYDERLKLRAGRCQPVKCYHLFSRSRYMHLQDYQTPEILRLPFQELCLHTKLLVPERESIVPPTLVIRNAVLTLKAWQKARAEGWERAFCDKNFISFSTMEMLLGMRVQPSGGAKNESNTSTPNESPQSESF